MRRTTRLLCSSAGKDDAVVPAARPPPFNVNECKDLISCLPPHLSMYIFGKAALIFPRMVSPEGHGWPLVWILVNHSVLLIPQGFWIKNPSKHVQL